MSLRVLVCGVGAAALLAACSDTSGVRPARAAVGPLDFPTGPAAGAWRFDFEESGLAEAPPGFQFERTGLGHPGRWIVTAVPDAPSGGHVLQQSDADATDLRFPVAISDVPLLSDFRVSVSARPLSGSVDQAFGLVFRYQDADNYYLVRANALEDNVRVYHVRDGRRTQLRTWEGEVTPGVWHRLEVQALGDFLRVSFDGDAVLEAHDTTFPGPGRFGVWTKADSVSQFDDLLVEQLPR